MAKKAAKKKAKPAAKPSRLKVVKKSVKKTIKKTSAKTVKKVIPKKVASKKTAPKPARLSGGKVAKPANKKTETVAASANILAVNPYLTFNGNCEEAFNFYRAVLGGNFSYIGRFKEMPPSPDGKTISAAEGEKIMHISLPLSKETSIMGSDSSEEFGQATVIGNNFSLSLNAPSEAEGDRIYKALAEGGKVTMPMSKTFWGSYFGMLTDKFGIQWMISC